jgi:hypothetical protein
MGKALYIQSVEDAASMAGGYDDLAAELGVSTDEVENWAAGTVIPDCAVFLRIIEILVNPSRGEIQQHAGAASGGASCPPLNVSPDPIP